MMFHRVQKEICQRHAQKEIDDIDGHLAEKKVLAWMQFVCALWGYILDLQYSLNDNYKISNFKLIHYDYKSLDTRN